MDNQSLNGLARPRSAALSQHVSQTSFGKYSKQNIHVIIDFSSITALWMRQLLVRCGELLVVISPKNLETVEELPYLGSVTLLSHLPLSISL
jgi:hypothetical protein